MAKKKKKRLFDLEAVEVSLVPQGKNNRKMLVTKESLEEGQMEEILKEMLETGLENEAAMDEKIEKSLPEEIRKEAGQVAKIKSTMKAAVKLLKGLGKQLPEDKRSQLMKTLEDLTGLKDVKKEATPAPEKKTETPATPEPVKKEAEVSTEIEKKIELIQKSNDDLAAENKDLKTKIAKERDIRVMKEFEDRAEKEFSHVGSKTEVAKILKEANDVGDEHFKSVEKVLKSTQAKLEAGNIFTEVGSSAGLSTDLDSKVAIAKEKVTKENPNLKTEAQVMDKVFQDNPDLYTQYLDENPAQGGY